MIGTPFGTNVETLIEEPNGPMATFSAKSSTPTVGHSETERRSSELLTALASEP